MGRRVVGERMRVAWVLGTLAVILVIAHGFANLAGGGSFDDDTDRMIYGGVQVIAGALMAGGLVVSARSRLWGVALVAAGILVISAAMPWFIIFTVPVGAGLAALANSRRRSGPRPTPASGARSTTN